MSRSMRTLCEQLCEHIVMPRCEHFVSLRNYRNLARAFYYCYCRSQASRFVFFFERSTRAASQSESRISYFRVESCAQENFWVTRSQPAARPTKYPWVSGLKFYLAEVEEVKAFTAPLTVIPDIGGDPNAYFVVKNCDVWRSY